MKRLLTTTALGMLLATAPAMAQTSTDTQSPASPPVEQSQPDSSAPSPMTPPAATAPDIGTSGMSSDTAKPDMAQSDTGVTLAEETLASNLIGLTVKNAEGESVGEINDIVLSQDGNAKAALVGVGGFLGLGAKNVAIEFSELDLTRDENNNMVATIAMSAESLQAMPAYKQPGQATDSSGASGAMKTQERAPAGESPTPAPRQ